MFTKIPPRPTDPVNSPDHYKAKGRVEAIDVIESFSLGFSLGNAVKYILRSGKKEDKVQDLKKAIWYLEHEIIKESQKKGRDSARGNTREDEDKNPMKSSYKGF